MVGTANFPGWIDFLVIPSKVRCQREPTLNYQTGFILIIENNADPLGLVDREVILGVYMAYRWMPAHIDHLLAFGDKRGRYEKRDSSRNPYIENKCRDCSGVAKELGLEYEEQPIKGKSEAIRFYFGLLEPDLIARLTRTLPHEVYLQAISESDFRRGINPLDRP